MEDLNGLVGWGDCRRDQGGSWPNLLLSLGILRRRAIGEQTASVLLKSASRGARLSEHVEVIKDTGSLKVSRVGE